MSQNAFAAGALITQGLAGRAYSTPADPLAKSGEGNGKGYGGKGDGNGIKENGEKGRGGMKIGGGYVIGFR